MKTYLLPFKTITEGTWEIQADSLEDAKKIVGMGWPYEHSENEEIIDVNTSWDVDALAVKDTEGPLQTYIIEASQRRYLAIEVRARSYQEADNIADELLTEDFNLVSTDFSIDNIYNTNPDSEV